MSSYIVLGAWSNNNSKRLLPLLIASMVLLSVNLSDIEVFSQFQKDASWCLMKMSRNLKARMSSVIFLIKKHLNEGISGMKCHGVKKC